MPLRRANRFLVARDPLPVTYLSWSSFRCHRRSGRGFTLCPARFVRAGNTTRRPVSYGWRASMECLDHCPMGINIRRHSGEGLRRCPSTDEAPVHGTLLLRGLSLTLLQRSGVSGSVRGTVPWGTQWGQLDDRHDPVKPRSGTRGGRGLPSGRPPSQRTVLPRLGGVFPRAMP